MLQAMLLLLGPALIKRVLLAFGIGVITYNVSTGVLDLISSQLQTNLSASPAIVLQMASLYGLPDFIGILLGAYSTSLTLTVVKKFGFL
jgi:hypothetical protein